MTERSAPGNRAGVDVATLYEQTRPRLVRLAFLLTGSSDAAEDLVQDVFVGGFTTLGRVDDPEGYLRVSVVNRCRSWHRRRFVARSKAALVPDVAAEPRDIELWQSLQRLSPRRRSAIVLRYYLDLPTDQIATHLGCREATVRSLLRRGLADVRRLLGEEDSRP